MTVQVFTFSEDEEERETDEEEEEFIENAPLIVIDPRMQISKHPPVLPLADHLLSAFILLPRRGWVVPLEIRLTLDHNRPLHARTGRDELQIH